MGDGDEEAPVSESPKGGVSAGVGKYKVHIADKQLPMVGMLFSGMVFLIAIATLGKGAKYWAYGISLGSVTMFFSIVGVLLAMKQELNDKVGMFNAYFLFLWCFIGACIFTFAGPIVFRVTSNGYFAAWGMAIFSIMAVGVTSSQMTQSVSDMGSLLGLLASSVIVIIATIDPVQGGGYRNESIYALTLACVTVLVAGGFWFKDRQSEGGKDMVKFFVLGFFALCWIVEACLVTFRGPFQATGNGYFGSWAGAVTSVFASMAALQ